MKSTASAGSMPIIASRNRRIATPHAPPVTWLIMSSATEPSAAPAQKTYATSHERATFAPAILMERRRRLESALDDHAGAGADTIVARRAVDVVALPPACEDGHGARQRVRDVGRARLARHLRRLGRGRAPRDRPGDDRAR